RLLVQRSEFARMAIDDERAHGAAFFAGEVATLIYRVKKSMIRVDGEETRADRFGGQLRRAQPSAQRIEAGDVDSLALPAGVGAEVHEELFRLARRRCLRARA